MTVSRTLAGAGNVSAEMRLKVWQAVDALGYHRNENARILRPGQVSGLIGVAITNLENPYYGRFALGVEQVAARYGRRILLGNSAEDAERERVLVDDFLGRQVEGLVVVPASGPAEHLRPSTLGAVPMVLASREVAGIEADTVMLDDIEGAMTGTRALVDAGHARIAFVGTGMGSFTGRRRFEGFSTALEQGGVRIDSGLVALSGESNATEQAQRVMGAMLDLPAPPSAVFCANNRNTIGVIRAIAEHSQGSGVKDLVSFDDFELADFMPMNITIVDHDPLELGSEAARLLFRRLSEGEGGSPRKVELRTRLRRAGGATGRSERP